MRKVGRNDLCPRGSGKKHKKCCLDKNDDVSFTNPENYVGNYKELKRSSGNSLKILISQPRVLRY
ncbi:SEC-C metal-binding domain-containing protein [Aquibacillus kalidii]|uniref:SEC-C metal-binding domain-containing protein n=1 Tax=Aquibacillus kalidii TaxID=2762597 RepID=UPI0016462A4C|nr:SEC-C metal-binding domain-containing protein [Aquibacillus kalidii]